jgi:hypothetical protein
MNKEVLRKVMLLAWQFVKRNGFTLSAALKAAWANVKLLARLADGIVKFYFQKVDGTIREAYGTLSDKFIPAEALATKEGGRKKNDTVQVYYDTERQEWRCFKKANIVTVK